MQIKSQAFDTKPYGKLYFNIYFIEISKIKTLLFCKTEMLEFGLICEHSYSGVNFYTEFKKNN